MYIVYKEWWLSGCPSTQDIWRGQSRKLGQKVNNELLVPENLTRGTPVIPDNTNKNYALTNPYPTLMLLLHNGLF